MDNQKSIIICKNSMPKYEILELKNYYIGYYLLTDPQKEICEDALLVRYNCERLMLAVCDGVGSSDRSYRAAKNTLSKISEMPLNINPQDLEQELLVINKSLIALEGSPQTTLTLVHVNKMDYTLFQVGDSGLIQCSNHGNLKFKSPIHSPVGNKLANGELSENQALEHPELHIVENILGTNDCYIEQQPQSMNKYDSLILTSDGILDNIVSEDLIKMTCQLDINLACENLYNSAINKTNILNNTKFNKSDDISFVCLKSK